MSFGNDKQQHYSEYRFNVYSCGYHRTNVSFEEIQNGLTKENRAADLAILRATNDLLHYRCLSHGNFNEFTNRKVHLQTEIFGVPAVVELVNDDDIAI